MWLKINNDIHDYIRLQYVYFDDKSPFVARTKKPTDELPWAVLVSVSSTRVALGRFPTREKAEKFLVQLMDYVLQYKTIGAPVLLLTDVFDSFTKANL